MLNYEAVVTGDGLLMRRPLCVVGWSMGGLAAMMACHRLDPDALVLLEPSLPGELQGFDPSIALEEGTYDPGDAYGPFPPAVASRPESRLARCERKRGVSVPVLACRTLVIYGDERGAERGPPVAARYAAEELYLAGASHWDLVLGKKAADAVVQWTG